MEINIESFWFVLLKEINEIYETTTTKKYRQEDKTKDLIEIIKLGKRNLQPPEKKTFKVLILESESKIMTQVFRK